MAFLKQRNLTTDAPKVWRNAVNVMTNDVNHGLLHSYLRHQRQWEAAVPQLSTIKTQLPEDFQKLITKVSTSSLQTLNREAKEEPQRVLKNSIEIKDGLHKAQELIHAYLKKNLPLNSSANIVLNKKGQKQARFTVPAQRGSKTLVVGTADGSPKARTKDEKMEYITTIYFESSESTKKRYQK